MQPRHLHPATPGRPSPLGPVEVCYHPLLTAETHNFPTGVAPFPGAETGTGGRIRDVQGTGRGGFVIAGTSPDGQLVELIYATIPAAARREGGHPAKRVFQALRIAVPDRK